MFSEHLLERTVTLEIRKKKLQEKLIFGNETEE